MPRSVLRRGANSPAPAATAPAPNSAPIRDAAPPVVTRHEIMVHGTPLTYIATTGMMPMKGATGETEANIFFVAYHRTDGKSDSADPHRPLLFAFNGGPGSASVWLHLGAIGPKRVQMLPDGGLPPPPYHLVDNEQTWLDQADLVFLDPVGTGYSRPTKPEYGAKFWGLQGDIAAAGDFIRLYLTRYKRWGSPLFLAGESYGTTRAAGLSNYLVEHGIALNGIALLSSVLNFQTLEFRRGQRPALHAVPAHVYRNRLLSPQTARRAAKRPELHAERSGNLGADRLRERAGAGRPTDGRAAAGRD